MPTIEVVDERISALTKAFDKFDQRINGKLDAIFEQAKETNHRVTTLEIKQEQCEREFTVVRGDVSTLMAASNERQGASKEKSVIREWLVPVVPFMVALVIGAIGTLAVLSYLHQPEGAKASTTIEKQVGR